jgi:hypothetical protein
VKQACDSWFGEYKNTILREQVNLKVRNFSEYFETCLRLWNCKDKPIGSCPRSFIKFFFFFSGGLNIFFLDFFFFLFFSSYNRTSMDRTVGKWTVPGMNTFLCFMREGRRLIAAKSFSLKSADYRTLRYTQSVVRVHVPASKHYETGEEAEKKTGDCDGKENGEHHEVNRIGPKQMIQLLRRRTLPLDGKVPSDPIPIPRMKGMHIWG